MSKSPVPPQNRVCGGNSPSRVSWARQTARYALVAFLSACLLAIVLGDGWLPVGAFLTAFAALGVGAVLNR